MRPRKWQGWTVSGHLFFIAICCTIPVACVSAFFAFHLVQDAGRRQQFEFEDRLHFLRDAIDLRIDKIVAQLEVLARSPSLQAGDLAAFKVHAEQTEKLIDGVTVLLADRAGHQILNTRPLPPGTPLPDRGNREAQDRVWLTGKPQVSDVYPAAVDRQPVVSVEVPVRISGEIRYVLAVGIPASRIGTLMDPYVPAGFIGSIIDRKGLLIARRPSVAGKASDLTGQKTIPEVLAHLGEPSAFWIKAVSRDGTPTYTSILKSDKTGWTVNLALPRDLIDGPLKQTALFFGALAVIAVVSGLLLSRVVASRFQKALFSLQEQVAHLGRRAILPAQPSAVSEINVMQEELHRVGADLQSVLRQQQILIDEINHRVKNTLATVQAIVRLSFSSETDIQRYAKSLEERLLSLSAAYNLLTENNWEGAELGKLTGQIVAPYAGDRVSATGPKVLLKPKTALALAAVVQELSTNAAKYGALSTDTGKVDIVWRATSQGVEFDWRESNGPTVHKPTRRGFGSQLIEDLFSAEVESKIELRYEPAGVRCHINFRV